MRRLITLCVLVGLMAISTLSARSRFTLIWADCPETQSALDPPCPACTASIAENCQEELPNGCPLPEEEVPVGSCGCGQLGGTWTGNDCDLGETPTMLSPAR